MGPPSSMCDCAAAVGTAQEIFLPRSKLGKPHRFLESLARGAVTQSLVQSLMVVGIEVGGDPMPGLALYGAGSTLVTCLNFGVHLIVPDLLPLNLREVPAASTRRPTIKTVTTIEEIPAETVQIARMEDSWSTKRATWRQILRYHSEYRRW